METSQFVWKKWRKESVIRMAVLHITSTSLFWVPENRLAHLSQPSNVLLSPCFHLGYFFTGMGDVESECRLTLRTQWNSKPPTISSTVLKKSSISLYWHSHTYDLYLAINDQPSRSFRKTSCFDATRSRSPFSSSHTSISVLSFWLKHERKTKHHITYKTIYSNQ